MWVAVLNQDNFMRMLEGGEITHRVRVMDRSAVTGTLGGPDGRTLFGLTHQGSIQDISKGKAASRIEMAGGYTRGWFALRAVSISAVKNTRPTIKPVIFLVPLSDEMIGVADGDRTRDNRSHNPVLYQLSYSHH